MHLMLICDINVEPTILVEECIVCCLECIVWDIFFCLCTVSSVLHGWLDLFCLFLCWHAVWWTVNLREPVTHFCSGMASGRRNIYHRGSGGTPLPSSYRNKALLIIAVTALYTAYLYHSGMSSGWAPIGMTRSKRYYCSRWPSSPFLYLPSHSFIFW